MDYITLSEVQYPVRWDLAALKEYKSLTKNDILSGIEITTENIIALTYVGVKAGYRFLKEDKKVSQEEIANAMLPVDIATISHLVVKQTGIGSESPGEVKPS